MQEVVLEKAVSDIKRLELGLYARKDSFKRSFSQTYSGCNFVIHFDLLLILHICCFSLILGKLFIARFMKKTHKTQLIYE